MTSPFLEHHNKWSAKHDSGGSFGLPILKIKQGTMQVRALDDEPISRVLHFNSIGKRPVICPEDGCLFCARGDESTTQHFVNVVDRSDNKVKVLVYSAAVAREISDLIQSIAEKSEKPELNDPKNYDMRIIREGDTRKTTRYTIIAVEGVDFAPDAYTRFDIKSKLKPMNVDEQKKNQGTRDVPSANVAGRGLEDFSGEPPSQVVKVPEVKTVIAEEDKEIL